MKSMAVIGSGMFVTGRGTPSHGTVIPALVMMLQDRTLDEVIVVVRSEESEGQLRADLERLFECLGWRVGIRTAVARSASEIQAVFDDCANLVGCIVCTPDSSHCDYGLACLRAGVATLMVKPLANTSYEARLLTETAEDLGVYAAVEFHKRLDPANRRLKLAFANGLIGSWHTGLVEYSQRRSIPMDVFGKWVSESNVYNYLGVHYADVIRFATGGEPVRVSAHGQYGILLEHGLQVHDTIQVLVEYELPAHGQPFQLYMQLGWNDPPASSAISHQRIQVVGSEGRIDSDQKHRGHQELSSKGLDDLNLYFTQPFLDGRGGVQFGGYGIDSIHQFARDCMALAEGAVEYQMLYESRPVFREAAFSTAVGDAVLRSIESSGEWIDVDTSWIVGARN